MVLPNDPENLKTFGEMLSLALVMFGAIATGINRIQKEARKSAENECARDRRRLQQGITTAHMRLSLLIRNNGSKEEIDGLAAVLEALTSDSV